MKHFQEFYDTFGPEAFAGCSVTMPHKVHLYLSLPFVSDAVKCAHKFNRTYQMYSGAQQHCLPAIVELLFGYDQKLYLLGLRQLIVICV